MEFFFFSRIQRNPCNGISQRNEGTFQTNLEFKSKKEDTKKCSFESVLWYSAWFISEKRRKKKSNTNTHADRAFFPHCLRSRVFLFIIWPESIQRTTFHNFDNFIKLVWPFETSFWKVAKQNTKKNIARSINFECTFISTFKKWNWFFFLYNEKCIKLSVPIRECII